MSVFIALAFELGALIYAEPLLLVDDYQSQVGKNDILAEQRLSTHYAARRAVFDIEQRDVALLLGHRRAQELRPYAERL